MDRANPGSGLSSDIGTHLGNPLPAERGAERGSDFVIAGFLLVLAVAALAAIFLLRH